MNYEQYLLSPEWQQKRTQRLQMDNFKCQRCGSPKNLQVHHINYERIFHEDVSTDLITLCKFCHNQIEEEKRQHTYQRYDTTVRNQLIQDFIKLNIDKDKSAGGSLDLCNISVIKPMLFKFFKQRGISAESGSSQVRDFFRNRRYEIILAYMEKGFPKNICQHQTNFNYNMISKVYNEPDIARYLLEEEKLNAKT